jgi:hypothetical protein
LTAKVPNAHLKKPYVSDHLSAKWPPPLRLPKRTGSFNSLPVFQSDLLATYTLGSADNPLKSAAKQRHDALRQLVGLRQHGIASL